MPDRRTWRARRRLQSTALRFVERVGRGFRQTSPRCDPPPARAGATTRGRREGTGRWRTYPLRRSQLADWVAIVEDVHWPLAMIRDRRRRVDAEVPVEARKDV